MAITFIKYVLKAKDGPFAVLPAAVEPGTVLTLPNELEAQCVRCGYAVQVAAAESERTDG